MKNKIKLLAMILVLAMILTSCGAKDSKEEDTLTQTGGDTTITSEVDSEKTTTSSDELLDTYRIEEKANQIIVTDKDVTFTDENMNEITIDKNPQRVVVLVNSYADLWYEAGGDIVGRLDSESELPDEYLDPSVITVGEMLNVNMEVLLGLSPDLVILRQGKQAELLPQLQENGISVISMEYDSIEDYLKYLKVFTSLNGEEELYKEYRDSTIKGVNEILEKVPSENNPDVLLILGATSSLKAYPSGTTNGQILKHLKANNIADEWGEGDATSLEINSEYVIASDPDYILIQTMSREEAIKENVEATFGTTDWWQSLSAVKNGNVIYLDRELFHFKPNGRYAEAYEEMAKIIYPEIFVE